MSLYFRTLFIHFVTLLIAIGGANFVNAQELQYENSDYDKILNKLDIEAGVCSYQGAPIKCQKDTTGKIRHIGFNLFDENVTEYLPHEITCFLERYFLELNIVKESSARRKMEDDKVVFIHGDYHDIIKIISSNKFILQENDKYYSAIWMHDGDIIVEFSFPKQYDLILGQNQISLERELYKQLCLTTGDYSYNIDTLSLQQYNDILIGGTKKTLYIDSVIDAYYTYDKIGFAPVFDYSHLAESAANIFKIIKDREITLNITQNLYGFKKINYNISMNSFLTYCKNNALSTYFSVEDVSNESISAILICQNDKIGYNHLIYAKIPYRFIELKQITINIELSAYIPSNNIKTLFSENQ